METFELQPTPENVLSAFEKDIIGRNADVLYFVSLLNSIDSAMSIAVDGRWGAGKTFFVKQVKMVLDAFNDHICSDYTQYAPRIKAAVESKKIDIEPQVSIYYDAWINDNDEDPILSLIYATLQSVSSDFKFEHAPQCVSIAASIAEALSGRNYTSIIDAAKSDDPLAQLREKKDMHAQIEAFLDSLLREQGNRLIIFVDELDRCKPTFAARLLERIKHYFTNDRITFVFSINISELQHTIKQYYGSEFDAFRYLDRFFDLMVDLPPANMDGLYLEKGTKNYSIIYERVCKAVISANEFSIRESARFYRLAKTAAYKYLDNGVNRCIFSEERAKLFCMLYILPIMLGLKISNQTAYQEFCHGKNPSPLYHVLSNKIIPVSLLSDLLLGNETFNPRMASEKVKLVNLRGKLEQVYDAVFVHRYEAENYEVSLGGLCFCGENKIELLKVASLLSDYADYEN